MDHGYAVVPHFLSPEVLQELRADVSALKTANKFRTAKIDENTNSNNNNDDDDVPFQDIRRSETCFIGRVLADAAAETEQQQQQLPPCKARTQLYSILDALRGDLSLNLLQYGKHTAGIGRLDEELEEVVYAYYPVGGYYRRHLDAEPDTISHWRKYSFLLYLQENWQAGHGGQLRIYRDGGKDHAPAGALPNFTDVNPVGGTLVVFRSDLLPHEVLRTHVERVAVVGWFLSSKSDAVPLSVDSTNVPSYDLHAPVDATEVMDPQVLEALRRLRDSVPGMARNLEPTPSKIAAEHQSGLLMDDFLFPDFTTPVQEEKTREKVDVEVEDQVLDDADPAYWKSIAAFDERGCIQTLSLGGQRLRKVDPSVMLHPAFLQSVTLDLGNTDLPITTLCRLINQQGRLRQLHLGGNALQCQGVQQLLEGADKKILCQLETLDLRYNDIGVGGASAIGKLLKDPATLWEKLYLEGNCLGDDGVTALSKTGSLLELYLGQNNIGPSGATALAQGLASGRLRKLMLEGNNIGPVGAVSFRTALELQGESLQLEKLYCDNNNIGKEESIKLGKALRSDTVIGDAAFFSD